MESVIIGIIMPFLGTTLGAACVFFMKDKMPVLLQKTLLGFASGVMIAASVWSLLIPALEMNMHKGSFRIVPALVGFFGGILFLLAMDKLIPHLHLDSKLPEGPRSKLSRTTMIALAVTLHNLPEGMAVGVSFAGATESNEFMSLAGAFVLSLGIAIQNFPEGAIIAMPLRNEGNSKLRSFAIGSLSGIVEPLGAIITISLASAITPLLPYLLAFAAGAMVYVVIEELIPETAQGKHSNLGTLGFAIGFSMMMAMDVILG